jgi:hypothetical protein
MRLFQDGQRRNRRHFQAGNVVLLKLLKQKELKFDSVFVSHFVLLDKIYDKLGGQTKNFSE